MRAAGTIVVALSLLAAPFVACDRRNEAPASTSTSAAASPKAIASPVVIPSSAAPSAAPDAPPVACAVAYADDHAGVAPGADLSSIDVPFRVPAGASLTIRVRKSDHEVTITGPAAVRPCTRAEPETILVASGKIAVDRTGPARPGAELFLATPSLVAVVARATVTLDVSATATAWTFEGGEARLTTLDEDVTLKEHDRGTVRRFSNGGLLLTRCGVQATAVANSERLLAAIASGSIKGAPPPLPASSIGILTAESVKHARERTLDCAFAEAFALSCDLLAAGEGSMGDRASGCQGGYAAVLEHVAKATAPSRLPPGSPPPKEDK